MSSVNNNNAAASASGGRFFHLYEDECIELLRRQALLEEQQAEEKTISRRRRPTAQSNKSRYDDDDDADSSSSKVEENENIQSESDSSSSSEHSYSSSSSSSSSAEEEEEEEDDAVVDKPQKQTKRTIPKMDERQRTLTIRKHFASLSCISLPLSAGAAGGGDDGGTDNNNNISTAAAAAAAAVKNVLAIPSSLLSKEDLHFYRHYHHIAAAASKTTTTTRTTLLNLAIALQTHPVIVLSLRSGRFAGAVFIGNQCVAHTTFQRYTVRKGQGKAQAAQDGQGRRPKSVGAQLRRAGEIALQQDVVQTLQAWQQQQYITKAVLIFLAVPKPMLKTVWDANVIAKNDTRIRKVPLDLGRPTFENVCLMHAILTTIQLQQQQQREEVVDVVPDTSGRKEQQQQQQQQEEENDRQGVPGGDLPTTRNTETITKSEPKFPKLSELHVAARDGHVEALQNILITNCNNNNNNNNTDKMIDFVNQAAGPDWMTPLHFAAQAAAAAEHGVDTKNNAVHDTASAAAAAAECVTLLLLQGHADPCLVDARNRPPYFLASREKVRDAFRMARAHLGEDYCAWDDKAKVGPPLTADDIQAKKDKEAEKRRKKKARQKEKKQKEKAQVAEAERLKREEEERQRQQEEAKRVRDGLAPTKVKTSSSGVVCDFCQTVCKGRKRSQMFKRLEYSYCSTDCVQKHKRELMAAAAQRRLGGS